MIAIESPSRWTVPVQYAAAIGLIALTAAVRLALDPILGSFAPFVLFLPALAFCAWYFAQGPCVIAALTGIVAVQYLFVAPRHSLLPATNAEWASAFVHAAAILAVGLFAWRARRAAALARQAEDERARSDSYAAHLLENMGEVFFAVDAGWRITYINRAAQAYLQDPSRDLLGKVLWEVEPRLASSEFAALAERAMEKRQNVSTELVGPASGRHFEVSMVPIDDGGLSFFARDVHEQRMIERALAESDHRIGEIIDRAGDCFMMVDRDWTISAINANSAAFGQTTPAEAIGRNLWELFSYLSGTVVESVLRQAMEDRQPARVELVGPRSGRIFDFMVIPSADGLATHARDVTILRQTAQVADDQQQKLRTLVDAVPALVAQLDREQRYIIANRAYLEWFGLASEEVEGRPLREILGDEALGHLEPLIGRVLAGEEVHHEALVPFSGQGRRWMNITLIPSRDRQGEVVGWFAVVQDVTARREQEDELRRANDRLQLAQEAAKLGTWEWEIETGAVHWTASLEQIHGLDPGTFAGTIDAALADIHPEDLPTAQEKIESALRAGGGTYANEYRIVLPGGAIRWIEAHGRVVDEEAGRPLRMVGVCADITERKLAELALRASETRFRTMANAAPMLIWIADTSGALAWFNRPWMEFSGRPMEEMTGDGWADDLHPDDLERCRRHYRDAFDARRPFEVEYRLRRHDGEYRWMLDHGTPLIGPEGEFAGYIGSCIDITERRMAEVALERHAQDLARSNQDLQDFAYVASHDLKEPLRGISNYATFVREDYGDLLDDKGREMLLAMTRQCKRMYSLLDALLHFSRLGGDGLRLQEVPFMEICREVIDSLPGAQDAQVTIACDEGATVRADRTLLAQVLANLINNALKYNESPRKIIEIGLSHPIRSADLAVGAESCQPILWVRDNGIGIDSRHHEKIFGMFKRLHGRDAYGGGTGTGLAIVRRIIERHGGRIWVESQGRAGSTFWFTLGAAQRPALPTAPTVIHAQPRHADVAAAAE